MILMNLFETFDPSTSMLYSLNWLIFSSLFLIMPMIMWMKPNQLNISMLLITNIFFYEFLNLTSKKFKNNIIIFYNLFMMIMILNLISLFPYIFTMTSHISLNLIIAIPLWLSFIMFMMFNTPLNLLIHLVPLNTPSMLMNFMVLIELISNIIRPWTLSIRLMANMIAGHLLLTLLGSFILYLSEMFIQFSMLLLIQMLLLILEISVAIIQAYVFSILMTLYFSESKY
uniref:ATP synthase subunit a n=1 Tax=Euaspis polynesia TaxID=1352276 RepID=A0A7T4WNX9_9HYME|nr:ATP synthase F0 subunit 6 [Euaspis polynesia]QQD78160.1 ATP synthase subunit 6 [Euaspis polynesia]